ncbi:ATP-binding protein [Metabacillus sp. HB246100]
MSQYSDNLVNEIFSIKEVLELSPLPVLLGNRGKFLYANKQALRLLEAEHVDDVVGKSVLDFTHSSSLDHTKAVINNLHNKNKHIRSLYHIVTKKENHLEIESMAVPITIKGVKLDYIVINEVSEITDLRKRYVIEKKQLKTLIDNSIDTVAIVKDNTFNYINKAGLKLFGVSDEECIIGKSVLSFFHPSYHDDMLTRGETVISKQSISDLKEREVIRVDGTIRYVESIVLPFFYEQKLSLQVIIRDITDQKQQLEHIVQSEKLLTAGMLSAGIAHEIRNPLTSIKGFLQLLEGTIPPENSQFIRIMKDELNKIERITGEMLALSKPQAFKHCQNNLILLLKEVITLLEPQAMLSNVRLKCNFVNERVPILCDKQQVKQVFINLVKNAIESMVDGGEVLITISQTKERVQIHLIDQGCGIPTEILSKINEPFFTTKGTGTGLGLTICHTIIKENHGKITVKSIVNEGTKFTVTLPIYNQKSD